MISGIFPSFFLLFYLIILSLYSYDVSVNLFIFFFVNSIFMVVNLLSIAFDNVCNSVIVFLISIQTALPNFSKNSKVIFKIQFILLLIIYEIFSCSISLPTLGIIIYLFLWLIMFTLIDHLSIHFSKVTVKYFTHF